MSGEMNMTKLSRNYLCWCGSGKKYKNCHLEEDEMLRDFEDQGYFAPPKDVFKTEEQIEGIRKSGRLTKRILDMVEEKIKAGVSTNEINNWVHEYTIQNGGIPAPLNYEGFTKSVCTSINNVICHGIPNDHEILKDGDIINVDVTTILDGYFSDASRMYIIGNASEKAVKLVNAAKECLYLGIREVKPYKDLNAIGDVIEDYAIYYFLLSSDRDETIICPDPSNSSGKNNLSFFSRPINSIPMSSKISSSNHSAAVPYTGVIDWREYSFIHL
jgi:methionyl aminopeptidase